MTELSPENVEDYPRPPALEPVAQQIEVWLANQLVARTDNALRVLETYHAPTYYIPPADITAKLEPAEGQSFCEWKGTARYWDICVDGARAARAGWSYGTPTPRFAALTGHLAIYASAMQRCRVGSQEVLPQPGDFYGGWVTTNLTGRIKGAPGTRHW